MEHNFNPNKGDYKYILEEERRKQNGEASTSPALEKQKLYDRFCNWILVTLLKRSKRTDQLNIFSYVMLEFFY